jgi:hypothetical protein
MALSQIGRTGATTQIASDTVLGLYTQDALSPLHSPGGLEGASGNTGYGQEFVLAARIAQTASGTTTSSFCSSNAPFKFRVIRGEVECLQDGRQRTERGAGRSSVNVMAGSTNTVGSLNVTGMRQGETRPLEVNTLGNEVIAENGSLSLAVVSVLPEIATSTTWELLVKLYCLRVI